MVQPAGPQPAGHSGRRAGGGSPLDAYLDQQLAARGLTDKDLALVGFSQGTMMALHVALRRAAPCASLVGYSGLLAAPELLLSELARALRCC